MADTCSATAGDDERAEPWAERFVSAHLGGWAGAVQRVLNSRGLELDMRRVIALCPEPDLLARVLDRAVTAVDTSKRLATFAVVVREKKGRGVSRPRERNGS